MHCVPINVILRGVPVTIAAVVEQEILHILTACPYSWLSSMQCACAMLSSLVCSALQYFPALSHKRHDFRENVIEHKMRVFRFSVQLLSETLLILRIIKRDIITNVHISASKVPVILERL